MSAVRGQVLALGSINADFQVRVERRPEVSETLIAHAFCRLGGGKAANVAFLGKKLGLVARLFGHVGDDDLAEQALAPLRSIGVDLAGVTRVAGMHTGVSFITVPPDGKKGIVLAPNANTACNEEVRARIAQALQDAPGGSVLVGDCEIDLGVLERAMRQARQLGITVVLDPSPASKASDMLLGLTDVLVPNAGEAESLTGIACTGASSAAAAARRLRERGARSACAKLPDGGCVVDDGSQTACISAAGVQVVDTTGAGDAFAGALAAALAEGTSLLTAARFAVAASQLAVTGYGSQPAYAGRREIEELAGRLQVDDDVERTP